MSNEEWLELARAGGIAAGVFIGLLVLRRAIRLLSGRTDDPRVGHALVATVAARTWMPLLLLVGLYAGTLALDLPDRARHDLRVAAMLAVFLQVGIWGNALLHFAANRYRERMAGRDDAPAPGTILALRFLGMLALWAVLLIVALDNAGIQVTALVAGLGIGGIAVALAAQSVLGDLFAGLAIILDRPFAIGDFVAAGDLVGTVEHVGVKTTRVRALSGEQVIVPNSDLVSARVHNYRTLQERRIVFRLGLTYDTTAEGMRRAVAIVREAIEATTPARFDRAHFAGYGDSSLDIEAVYYVESDDYVVYMDTHEAIALQILERFGAEGLDFAFPTRTVHIVGAAAGGAR